ncbi:hypothetical protein SUGI_0354920 [Cryptomeria japonica]|nr:hypothetical protein SUGI_0354920 [Cryptomeria japonica]
MTYLQRSREVEGRADNRRWVTLLFGIHTLRPTGQAHARVGCVEIHMGSSASMVLCAADSASAAIPKRLALLSIVKSRKML